MIGVMDFETKKKAERSAVLDLRINLRQSDNWVNSARYPQLAISSVLKSWGKDRISEPHEMLYDG